MSFGFTTFFLESTNGTIFLIFFLVSDLNSKFFPLGLSNLGVSVNDKGYT